MIYESFRIQNPGPYSKSLSEDSSVVVVVVGVLFDFESLSSCPSELVSSEVFLLLTGFGLGLLSFGFFVFVDCFAIFVFDFLVGGSSSSSLEPLK